MRRILTVVVPATGLCLGLLLAAGAGDEGAGRWPALRGPLFTGVAPGGDPPIQWSETSNIRWKVPLTGQGHATPIVWDDRIYVLSAVSAGKAQETPAPEPGARAPRAKPTTVHRFVVTALERATGRTIWSTVVREEVPHEPGHETASRASATPVTDGERIYAFFGSRGLYCLDRDGGVKWSKDLGDMRTRNEFGEGSSPILHGDTLVVNWDHEGEDFIVAFDKRTGEERWRTAREEPTSWSTPLVLEDAGRALVVVSATNRVRAYDLKTGAEAWSCGGLGLNCIPTPVEGAGLLFVMSGYQEAAGMAIRYAGARGDITGSDRTAWRIDRGTSYVASPLLYEGKLYLLERLRAALSCHDLATGRAHYAAQRLEGLGTVYASPAGAGGRVYIVDREGNAAVIRHGDKFELMASNKLDDGFDASPVIVGGELILRGHKHLYSIAQGAAQPPPRGSVTSPGGLHQSSRSF
jgi:outer membrane protein assembly factor BamB